MARDLDEEVAPEPHLLPLEQKRSYRRQEQGWTCIKAVPDTGAHASVAPSEMAPNYQVKPSAGSLSGQEFVSAAGTPIPNQGQQTLPMQSAEGVWTNQRWQIAPVTRPLLSIGEECDQNNMVVFGRSGGAILNLESGSVRRFPRVRGSYEMELWIPPAPGQTAQEAVSGMGFPRRGT